jgi:hypothetical protein
VTRARKRNLEILYESPGGNRAGLFALWQRKDDACCSNKVKTVTRLIDHEDRETRRHPCFPLLLTGEDTAY